jgi:hypothetical protein
MFLLRTLYPFLGSRIEEWADRGSPQVGHIAIRTVVGRYNVRGPVYDGDVFYDMSSFYPETYEKAWEWS